MTPMLITIITKPRLQVLLAFLFLCLILIFSASVFIYQPYDGMTVNAYSTIYIEEIDPGGPAEFAGLLVGDRLLSINGKRVDSIPEQPLYPPLLKPGDLVTYTIDRGGQEQEVRATMGSYWDNLRSLLPILVVSILSLIFWTSGLVICLFSQPEDFHARLIGLSWLLAGLATSAGGPGNIIRFWGANLVFLLGWVYLGATMIIAHMYFPSPLLTVSQRNLVISLLIFIAAALTGLEIVDNLILMPRNHSLANIGFYLNRIIYIWFFIAILFSMTALIYSRFLAKEVEIQRQTGIVLLGLGLSFSPFFFVTLLPAILFRAQGKVETSAFSLTFLVFIPISYIYVIYQRQLLRLDFFINRMVVFLIQTLLVMVSALLVFLSFVLILKLPSQIGIIGSLAVALVAFFSAESHKIVQRQVNRILYGTKYDHVSVTADLSNELSKILDRSSLTFLLTKRLPEKMGIQTSALYLEEENIFRLQGQSADPVEISTDSELIRFFGANHKPELSLNLWRKLSNQEQYQQNLSWVNLFIPIIFENQLIGLLLLGNRLAGDFYSAYDLVILDTVSHQTALAVANIQLVDSLRNFNKQLVNAEDERRKKIARELHDAILQDIFLIKNQVMKLPESDKAARNLDVIIQKLRQTIRDQRPDLLDVSLPLALQSLVEETQNLHNENGPCICYKCNINDQFIITEIQAVSIYRITQEALNNAIKYACASRITISFDSLSENTIRLAIVDDGIGINKTLIKQNNTRQHFGISSMRERAHIINGQLNISSETNCGTVVELILKL